MYLTSRKERKKSSKCDQKLVAFTFLKAKSTFALVACTLCLSLTLSYFTSISVYVFSPKFLSDHHRIYPSNHVQLEHFHLPLLGWRPFGKKVTDRRQCETANIQLTSNRITYSSNSILLFFFYFTF